MNRSIVKKNKPSYRVVLFWSIIALLTLIFVGFVIVKFIESREVTSVDVITNLKEDQIFQQDNSYYVYVYSKVGVTEDKYELEKANEIEESILTYLTYVKRNSDANKMYGMIVDQSTGNYGNYSCLIFGDGNSTSVVNKTKFADLKIHVDDLPIILKIEDGKVKSAFLTEKDIRQELQTAMGIE